MTHDNDKIDIDFELAPPDKLYVHNRRQLSAMLDGELSPDQARFMLRRLQHDAELVACWERWQVCGDLLRGHGHALLPADFSKRVADAIAAPAVAGGARSAADGAAQRPHRLLRWGGGALAASMALVALFAARQLPGTHAPELVDATGPARSAPALVQGAPPAALADARVATASVEPAPSSDDVAALLAAAAPAAVAVAEVPRRAAERTSTRSQSQRAATRRSQGATEVQGRAVAAAPPSTAVPRMAVPASAATDMPMLANLPSASIEGDALFGTLPAAGARPWPRAVLPGLTGTQPFAARYGMPQPEAFAPFQPRLDRHDALPTHGAAAASQADAPADVDGDPPVGTGRPPAR